MGRSGVEEILVLPATFTSASRYIPIYVAYVFSALAPAKHPGLSHPFCISFPFCICTRSSLTLSFERTHIYIYFRIRFSAIIPHEVYVETTDYVARSRVFAITREKKSSSPLITIVAKHNVPVLRDGRTNGADFPVKSITARGRVYDVGFAIEPLVLHRRDISCNCSNFRANGGVIL